MSRFGPDRRANNSRWTVTEGRTPDGRDYAGTLELVQDGEAWRLRWHIDDEAGPSEMNGVGFWKDGVLYASRSNVRSPERESSFPGIVVYETRQFGHLPATWYHPELRGRLGKGVSVDGPINGLSGTYVAEYGSQDTEFDPLVKEIRQSGELYRLVWCSGGEELFNGIGASVGQRLAAAWATPPRSDIDLVRFERSSVAGEMTGTWCSNQSAKATASGLEVVRH